ncbi:MAG: glycosyl transferase [Rhizobiales bacterium PAR1]|nr:MAG: glycosyl transferase [Rhizobiales bacterium PAR1]
MATTFHIVQRMAPGGIESIVLDLARLDPDVRVVSLESDRASLVKAWPPLAVLGERLITLSKPEGLTPGLWLSLAALFRIHDVRAIVTHHIGPLVYAGIAAVAARVKRRIHVEHDGWHYAGAKRRILARMIEKIVAPRRVAVSSVTAGQVANALGTLRQTVIPNGVDLERFRLRSRHKACQRFGLPENRKLIGLVGRLEHVKGQDVLIDALGRLDRTTHLVLAGDGSTRATLAAQVLALGLSERVHFMGSISEPEALYPAFDVFCLPSRAEGFPRTLIEAQACDIPVVACDVGGAKEAVCPSTGRLVPAERPDLLAEALTQTLEMPSAVSPRQFVDPTFSNAIMVDRYRALIDA